MKLFVRFLIFIFFVIEMSISSEKINIFNFDDNDLTKFKSHSIKKKQTIVLLKKMVKAI